MKKYKAIFPKIIKIVDTDNELEFRTGKYIKLGVGYEFFDTFKEAQDWLLKELRESMVNVYEVYDSFVIAFMEVHNMEEV